MKIAYKNLPPESVHSTPKFMKFLWKSTSKRFKKGSQGKIPLGGHMETEEDYYDTKFPNGEFFV